MVLELILLFSERKLRTKNCNCKFFSLFCSISKHGYIGSTTQIPCPKYSLQGGETPIRRGEFLVSFQKKTGDTEAEIQKKGHTTMCMPLCCDEGNSYQMITRSCSGRNIAPELMSKALWKVSILRRVTFTRFLPSECTSVLVRRAISSSRMVWPQMVA